MSSQPTVLPTLDLRLFQSNSAAERAQFVRELSEALTEYGFFYLVGHGISHGHRRAAMASGASLVTN
jgi:isopenicillin N synthase-like dioxygenase